MKLRIFCIFAVILLFSLSFISINYISANEKENLVFDPYEVANARYIVTSVKGQIEIGTIVNKGNKSNIKPVVINKKTIDLNIDDVEFDTKLNALFVYVQDFMIFVRFGYDKDRKIWIKTKESSIILNVEDLFLPDKFNEFYGWFFDRDEYISNLDIDEFGYIREYKFKYKLSDNDIVAKRIGDFEEYKKDKNFSKVKFYTLCSKTDIRITFKKVERD